MILEEEEEEEDTDVRFFYLWTTNEQVYSIYDVARWYLGDGMLLSSAQPTILTLIQESTLKAQDTLSYIACIHAGYSSILLQENGNG